MSKVKNGDIILKKDKKILLGDASIQQSSINGLSILDPYNIDLTVVIPTGGSGGGIRIKDGGIEIKGDSNLPFHLAIGNNASLNDDYCLYLDEKFRSTGFILGQAISVENEIDDASTYTVGLYCNVQNNSSVLHHTIAATWSNANAPANGCVINQIVGGRFGSSVPADNCTITEALGGLFGVGTGYSMVGASFSNMVAGQFQVLDGGSGDVSITNAYGVLIKAPSFSSSGTTDNLYGLYIEDQSNAGFTSDYNFYSAGISSRNKIEGNLEANSIDATSLTVTGTVDLPTGAIEARDVAYNILPGAMYSTVQDGLNQLNSAGVISGGVISEDTTSSIFVTAGEGLIRTSNDSNAPLVFISWSNGTLHIPDNSDKTIVVKYNGGSPILAVEDPLNVNLNNMIVLGQVKTITGSLFNSNVKQRSNNFKARILGRLYDDRPVIRSRGTGLILGESADNNRHVSMTGGTVWNLLEKSTINAINTATGDKFATYWRDGAGDWNCSCGESTWPNTKYDDGSGVLQDLGNKRYGSVWFYLIPTDNSLHMVYGRSNSKSLSDAEAETPPSDIPVILREASALIGRILFKKDDTIAQEVQSAFDTVFNFSATTNHSNLNNLDADDHIQYSLVSGGRDFTGTVGGVYPTSDSHLATKEYVDDRVGRVRKVYGDSTAVDGDIILVDSTNNITITCIESVDAKIIVKSLSTGNVTIQGSSGTIDDQANKILTQPYTFLRCVCDGVDWFII